MRRFVFLFVALLATSLMGGAQKLDCVSVAENGDEVTLRAESWDPVLAVARTLAHRYGIKVTVEAPKWNFPADTEDVAVADPAYSEQHGNIHYAVMKRHVLEVHFSSSAEKRPNDVQDFLRQVADAANSEMPYGYRLDVDGDDFALVPTSTRSSTGATEKVLPLLDRKVTIPSGTRTIAEHARLMADDLSRQTGLHVGCCQMVVAGVPWGTATIEFAAKDQPAREVLKQLMLIEQRENSHSSSRHPEYDHWEATCDGTGAPWCRIEVVGKPPSECP